jgi:tetratricopeptide (TPR) repeat protein
MRFVLALVTVCIAPFASRAANPPTRADSLLMAKSWYDLAVSDYSPGRLDSAIVAVNMALRWNPKSPEAWHLKGSTLGRMLRHEEARCAFDEALRLRPDYALAWWHRGCDNAVAKRYEEALSDLGHAIASDSSIKSWPFEDACWDSLVNDPRLLEMTK